MQRQGHSLSCSDVPRAASMWTRGSSMDGRNGVSGWLLHCAQVELWCLHELQDRALDERNALEEHQLRRRRHNAILGGTAEEPNEKG